MSITTRYGGEIDMQRIDFTAVDTIRQEARQGRRAVILVICPQ